MIDRRRFLHAGMAAAAAMSLAPRATAQVKPTTVTGAHFVEVDTADGRLRGGTSRGALAFKGIPYAGLVSGANRFKAPSPIIPWSGVRDATRLGAPSLQKPNSTYGELEPAYAEDCLFLNVWTPAAGDGRKRPVMVYCHGGGYATGSAGSTSQDGAKLAATYDVVTVASNHRLGLLGYMYLGGLSDEYAAHANPGLLDIIACLQWVKRNIAAFGGNPDNVMIFGESGGGFKVGTLMAMPAAHGLFHKASIESGAALRRMPKDVATETAVRVLKALDIAPNELHRLADVPGQAFVDFQLQAEQGLGPLATPRDGRMHTSDWQAAQPGTYGPVVDGLVLPDHPFDPVATAVSANVPLLIGHNRDEATFFNWGRPDTFGMGLYDLTLRLATEFGDDAVRLLSAYRAKLPGATPSDLYIAIASDRVFGYATAVTADRKSAQPAPVYRYRMDYQSNFPIADGKAKMKAGHATEIPIKMLNDDIPGLQGDGPGLHAASLNMSAMWTRFARDGKPSAPGAPDWPRYETAERAVMVIDSTCQIVHDPDALTRPVWEAVAD